jgi:hypothetical protein
MKNIILVTSMVLVSRCVPESDIRTEQSQPTEPMKVELVTTPVVRAIPGDVDQSVCGSAYDALVDENQKLREELYQKDNCPYCPSDEDPSAE